MIMKMKIHVNYNQIIEIETVDLIQQYSKKFDVILIINTYFTLINCFVFVKPCHCGNLKDMFIIVQYFVFLDGWLCVHRF